jgi:hypothetical protein
MICVMVALSHSGLSSGLVYALDTLAIVGAIYWALRGV